MEMRRSKSRRLTHLGTLVFCSATLFGQTSRRSNPDNPNSAASTSPYTPHLAFDVASIREAREGNVSYSDNPSGSSLYHGERLSVWGLVLAAYDIQIPRLLENLPAWGKTVRYNITAKSDNATDDALAKLSENDSRAEKRHMMQLLLAERFHLQIRTETRMTTTYELVQTARTAKLMTPVQGEIAETAGTCYPSHYSWKGIEVESRGCPFSIFFSLLQQEMGTNVIDHTGMTGLYAYHLMYLPSTLTLVSDEGNYSSTVDAVREQLGLDFKKTKGPVTFWIIDRIERPTPN